jgi:hypothetical protein
MPRGGYRPGTGGKRPGAGRKKGSATRRTRKTNALAQKAAGEGPLPLQVMLEAMRYHQARGELDAAAEIARHAAPYLHPRLAPVHDDGGEREPAVISIVQQRIEVPVGAHITPDGRVILPDGTEDVPLTVEALPQPYRQRDQPGDGPGGV